MKIKDIKRLGPLFGEKRRSLGMTRRQIAAKIGLPSHYLGRIERGERNADPDQMIEILRCVGIKVEIKVTDE